MPYFLAKTDPDDYSIYDFERDGTTNWDGIHSNPAILNIRKMMPGDLVYIYLSQSDKAVAALAEVTGTPYENTADPRRSWTVAMRFVKRYEKPVTLAEMMAEPSLSDFMLIRNSRLSVMPVPEHVVVWLEARLA